VRIGSRRAGAAVEGAALGVGVRRIFLTPGRWRANYSLRPGPPTFRARETSAMGMYRVRKSVNRQYYFNLHADNGEKILTSEMYTTKGAAFGGISSCKVNSPHDARYSRFDAVNGQLYFTLKAENGEPIGKSETYTTRAARETGIASVKSNGPTSGTVDETGE
jgi:uncharacterized protein YegP (UPF0339 family)